MAWADRLLQGSFRGAEFGVQAHTASGGGRRAQVHEYPGRDTPFVEDLGRRAHEFRLRAFVVGDDYDRDRDRLRAACNVRGPGILIHPYLGVMSAVCLDLRIIETTRQGRMATFDLTFVEAGGSSLPLSLLNPAALVASAVSAAQGAVRSAFSTGFRL